MNNPSGQTVAGCGHTRRCSYQCQRDGASPFSRSGDCYLIRRDGCTVSVPTGLFDRWNHGEISFKELAAEAAGMLYYIDACGLADAIDRLERSQALADYNNLRYSGLTFIADDTELPDEPELEPDLRAESEVGDWRADPSGFDYPVEKRPALLSRDDGETLLYAGAVNWASGLPGSGKSWLGLLTSRHVIRNGGRAAYIDYEDSQPTLGNRARLLGLLNNVRDPDRFAYIPGGLIEEPGNRDRAIAWLAEADLSVAVIDTPGSAGCPMNGDDVRPWLTQHVEPFRAADVGVVCLDHIPKQRIGRPAGPIGSVHKLATVDGAALRISGTPWTTRTPGRFTLSVDKDRHGQLPGNARQPIAAVIGTWHEGTFAARIAPADQANQDETQPDLTDQLLVAIRTNHPNGCPSTRALRQLLNGVSNDTIDQVANEAVEVGLLTRRKQGNAVRWTLTEAGLQRIGRQRA